MTKMAIREKISILKDFCILKKTDTMKIEATKKLLANCTDFEAERLLRGVFTNAYTLDQLLAKKGMM